MGLHEIFRQSPDGEGLTSRPSRATLGLCPAPSHGRRIVEQHAA